MIEDTMVKAMHRRVGWGAYSLESESVTIMVDSMAAGKQVWFRE